jgi:hypothetical protein
MDIKYAQEKVKVIIETTELVGKIKLDNEDRQALQTLIDYCSEPKPELNEKEISKIIDEGRKKKLFNEEIAELICSHFSWPKIKYPEYKESDRDFERGFNCAIDDMKALNKEVSNGL